MFDLSLEVLRVVEEAAIASARTMGKGNADESDQAAVESMRRCLDTLPSTAPSSSGRANGTRRPCFISARRWEPPRRRSLTVDIAVDPLEGTNLCCTGGAGAITVLAASEGGGLLHAPDCYMEKIVVGPAAKGSVDLDAPVKQNLKSIARRLQRGVDDLVVVVLDRPRHQQLIADIREAGARIRLISDGDLSAGIAAAVAGTGVHAVMGSGGAPEGVLTAAALRCLNGEILGRLIVKDDAQKERMQAMGIRDTRPHLYHAGTCPRQAFGVCGVRRHRWQPAPRRSLHRRRRPHPIRGHDVLARASPLYRHEPTRKPPGCEGSIPLTPGNPEIPLEFPARTPSARTAAPPCGSRPATSSSRSRRRSMGIHRRDAETQSSKRRQNFSVSSASPRHPKDGAGPNLYCTQLLELCVSASLR